MVQSKGAHTLPLDVLPAMGLLKPASACPADDPGLPIGASLPPCFLSRGVRFPLLVPSACLSGSTRSAGALLGCLSSILPSLAVSLVSS
jgi:hypothetical protein